MSLEHSPARSAGIAAATSPADDDPNYWHGLINEREAAKFLHLTVRTLQGLRQRGGGAKFIRLSSRCVRYRRIDLRNWVEARLRSSTSDPGPEGATS